MRELEAAGRRAGGVFAPRWGDRDVRAGDAEATAAVFKALSDPARVRIVNLLANADGPVCVSRPHPELRLVAARRVSFHLKKLVQAGLLEREQRGVWAFYAVNREVLPRLGRIFELEGASA